MWAWVNDETLNRYFTETKFFLHPSEWNEGNYLIVVDFCCLFNSRKVISSLLKDSKITQGNRVHYCVRNEKGIPVKSSNRSRL
jgi:hemolysin-activating ACP:hemolysin acyltransferase